MVWSLSSVRVIGSWFREKRFKCSHSDPKMVDHIHAMLISCNGIKINMFSALKARSFVNQLYPPISAKFSGKQSSPLGKWKTFGNYQSFNIPPSTLGTDSSVCVHLKNRPENVLCKSCHLTKQFLETEMGSLWKN